MSEEVTAQSRLKSASRFGGVVTLASQRVRNDEMSEELTAPLTSSSLEADRWRQSLKDEGLAEATVSKRVKTARQMFRQGVKWKMLAENPFEGVRAGSQTNRERMFFIDRATIAKVLDACPDWEWRLVVALSRYGGLRCPSEHLALRWADIDWEKGRMVVRSPKTDGMEGREYRVVPLFPELRPYLMDAFDHARTGAEFVIVRCRTTTVNLRTQMLRILARAGVAPWPRLFQNLRSSRQTELAEQYPVHVVCAWLGNTPAVAMGHYLQVHDGHYAMATGPAPSENHAARGRPACA